MHQKNVLVSGRSSFRVQVPIQLFETGSPGIRKPMLVYLHGYNQTLDTFLNDLEGLQELEAYHLFVEGPWPVIQHRHPKPVSQWGRAWYLYDGEEQQFRESMEATSEFLQKVIDRHLRLVPVERLALIGYSMGGYLAGYFAMTRWKHVNELAMIGARFKTEWLSSEEERLSHMNILALHGENDKQVSANRQKKEIDKLQKLSVSATFKAVPATHEWNPHYVSELLSWFKVIGYRH